MPLSSDSFFLRSILFTKLFPIYNNHDLYPIPKVNILYCVHPYPLGCDMIFNSTTGNFTSPGFPSSFLSNKQCSYGINAPTGKTIQISFISFDLGRLGCTYAEMKIYEGSSATGQPVLNKCGTARDAFISRGNRLYITFKATYMTGSGFHIKFAVREGRKPVAGVKW